MMDLLLEAREYIPMIKIVPKKVSDIESSIYELREMIRSEYITYS